MRKSFNFSIISEFVFSIPFFLVMIFLFVNLISGCAFTEYGNRINQEQLDISKLEDKRQSLETSYIIVLNSLETHPTEEKLIAERDRLRNKLRDIDFTIQQKRKGLDQSFLEWEQKIVQEKVEREMINNEIRENGTKNEDVDFQNK